MILYYSFNMLLNRTESHIAVRTNIIPHMTNFHLLTVSINEQAFSQPAEQDIAARILNCANCFLVLALLHWQAVQHHLGVFGSYSLTIFICWRTEDHKRLVTFLLKDTFNVNWAWISPYFVVSAIFINIVDILRAQSYWSAITLKPKCPILRRSPLRRQNSSKL